MFGNFWRFLAAAAIFAVPVTVTGAEQLGLSPVPEHGVVLLSNGQVIEGKITRVGELIYVTFPNGEIRLKLSEVEFCCRDLKEGYRRKRAAMQPGNVRHHLAMTQWCLRHGLPDHAAAELSDAMAAEPSHPMIGVLNRRLKMATQPPSKPSRGVEPAEPSPSFEELDRLVRRMPPGTVETFTDTIQPMLVNNCTAAGCHGPQPASEFWLIRIPKDRPPQPTNNAAKSPCNAAMGRSPAAGRQQTAYRYNRSARNRRYTHFRPAPSGTAPAAPRLDSPSDRARSAVCYGCECHGCVSRARVQHGRYGRGTQIP